MSQNRQRVLAPNVGMKTMIALGALHQTEDVRFEILRWCWQKTGRIFVKFVSYHPNPALAKGPCQAWESREIVQSANEIHLSIR